MNKSSTVEERFEAFLQQEGVTVGELLKGFISKQSKILGLSDEIHQVFSQHYHKLKLHNDQLAATGDSGLTNTERGELLEQMARCLFFEGNAFFEEIHNARSSSNEIDLLIKWSSFSKLNQINNSFPFMSDTFFCECKNYSDSVSVTYVGKFYSLLKVSNKKFGIVFSLKGVTGRGNWADAKSLIKKIALKDGTYIIDFNFNDLTKIYKRESNFFSIVSNKYEALISDIDYHKYIEPHELEHEFSKYNID